MNKIFTLLLVCGGICLLFGLALLLQRQFSGPVAFNQIPSLNSTSTVATSSGQLNIPHLGINLPIDTRSVAPGQWPLSTTSIIHISGTTIYYGHNWPRLLGPLTQIKLGDQFQLDGSTYRVDRISTVTPADSTILNSTSPNQVILYTCTGFLDLLRFVVIATVVE